MEYLDYFGVQLGEAEPLTEWGRKILNNNIVADNHRNGRTPLANTIPADKIGKKRLFYAVVEVKGDKATEDDMYTVWEDEVESELRGLTFTGENLPSDSGCAESHHQDIQPEVCD